MSYNTNNTIILLYTFCLIPVSAESFPPQLIYTVYMVYGINLVFTRRYYIIYLNSQLRRMRIKCADIIHRSYLIFNIIMFTLLETLWAEHESNSVPAREVYRNSITHTGIYHGDLTVIPGTSHCAFRSDDDYCGPFTLRRIIQYHYNMFDVIRFVIVYACLCVLCVHSRLGRCMDKLDIVRGGQDCC